MAFYRNGDGFSALKIEGGILPMHLLQSVAALEAPRQAGTDYGLYKSLVIKEELARYWRIANDLYSSYIERRPTLSESVLSVEEWLVPFFREVLGYDDLVSLEVSSEDDQDSTHPHDAACSHCACRGVVPMLLVAHDVDLDKLDSRIVNDGRRVIPHRAIQEYLNTDNRVLWGILSNGSKLRLLRENASITRSTYIEVDLDLIFSEELYSDFAALWLIAHSTRVHPSDDKPASCIIEEWRSKAHETGERIRENLRHGVAETLNQLGNGFLQHPNNTRLRDSLNQGNLSSESYFQQLLELVYRMLFLFTVEERDLLHHPGATDYQKAVYEGGYGLSRLRERALRRRHYDRNQDLWQGLKITFSALAEGADGLGIPALGGLFRRVLCPDLDEATIANENLLEAIRTLCFFRSDTTITRVNYKDMDTEELGSVYESLLEYQPVIEVDGAIWTFTFAGINDGQRTKGSVRKLTGSYYTPPSLVGELIKSTLEPIIAETLASNPENPRAAILNLNVIDPACGSGHFLLASARRLADEITRIESDSEFSTEIVRQHALREVVQHCIYGVDVNSLAVELCKTALWIETVEPGKPLTFLDSHIVKGNSFVGIQDPKILGKGIPATAYKALTGDDKDVCAQIRKRNSTPTQDWFFDEEAALEVAVANIDLDVMPENTLDDIERKRIAWETTLSDKTRTRELLRADLFVSAWFAQKTKNSHELVPQTKELDLLERGLPLPAGVEKFVQTLAGAHSFFHWHITFGEIYAGWGVRCSSREPTMGAHQAPGKRVLCSPFTGDCIRPE